MPSTDFLDQVASYLDTQNVGVYDADSGRNIFVNDQPAEPVECITLFGNEGLTLPESKNIRSLIHPRFQVVCRSADYDAASALHYAVRDALHARYGIILANWRILECHAEQEGGPVGKDKQNRHEFSCNYMAEANAQTAP